MIVTWSRPDLLRSNVASWRDQTIAFARRVLVINASLTNSAGDLSNLSDFDLIHLQRNVGFAEAANRGIALALEDPEIRHVALVNDDVRLAREWHEVALEALTGPSQIGGVASGLLRADRPERIDTAGITWSAGAWADNYLSGREVSALGTEPSSVFGVSAAACLLRRELLEGIGLFDPSFFAYQEDVDLALRAQTAGWRFLLAPNARGWHDGHASNRPFPLGGTWADYFNARNRLVILAKSLPAAHWKQHWRSILATHAAATARSFGERRAGAVIAGSCHAVLRLPGSLVKRIRGGRRRARVDSP